MKQTAIDAAHQASQILLKYYHGNELEIRSKSTQFDMVTQADLEAEEAVVATIRSRFPDHAVWTEENGQAGDVDTGYVWLIDPLDGTNNFVHRYPIFSVAITLFHQADVILSVVYDPLRDELFVAEKGRGVTRNGQPVRVSDCQSLAGAMISTGFPYVRQTDPQNNLAEFSRIMPLVQGVRRSGSAALDMAYIACGRLDGHWEFHLSPWDWMGGSLMIEEAGGVLTDIAGKPWSLDTQAIIAGNPHIHRALLDVISSE